MRPARWRSRWRAGAKGALYLIAFGIVAGGALIAIGILFLLFIGVLFGGGFMAVLVGLGFIWYFVKEDQRERVAR